MVLELESPYLFDFTTYTVRFEMSSPVGPSDGCYVKYTFPDEIDISEIDLENV